MKEIAKRVAVSLSTVSLWTRDIELTPEQLSRNLNSAARSRAQAWTKLNRDRRSGYQQEGRQRAREEDLLHMAGCILYWAEGFKHKNQLAFANSDPHMMRFFCKFLRLSLGVDSNRITLRLNVYTGNGLTIEEIEDFWLESLELPRACLRGHVLNHTPTSSSGKKKNRLPYGVAHLSVLRSTRAVQHIFGAIQEYGGFEEPRWLNGPPVKPSARRARAS